MRHIWILSYSCCPDIAAYSSKAKAVKEATKISAEYESNSLNDYGDTWECLSLKTADCLIFIYRLDVN